MISGLIKQNRREAYLKWYILIVERSEDLRLSKAREGVGIFRITAIGLDEKEGNNSSRGTLVYNERIFS